MEKLWAPWRMEYIEADWKKNPKVCVFCDLFKTNELKENLILYRDASSLVVLNRYPYANGHLLVIPKRHISEFEMLADTDHSNVMRLAKKGVEVLKKALAPQGFNLGCNLGKVSGAGIAEHIHFHIVPRWLGDCNFMPILGQTKIISEHLNATYAKLAVAYLQLGKKP